VWRSRLSRSPFSGWGQATPLPSVEVLSCGPPPNLGGVEALTKQKSDAYLVPVGTDYWCADLQFDPGRHIK